jgi:hypothetical protein
MRLAIGFIKEIQKSFILNYNEYLIFKEFKRNISLISKLPLDFPV